MDRLDFALELKGVNDSGVFEGYASTFGEKDLGGDIVVAGAFAKSLKATGAKGVKMFADHDSSKRVGVWTDISEDSTGLHVKGRLLLEKQIAKDIYVDLKEGALDAMSIGYRAVDHKYDGRRKARMLNEVKLMEISLVGLGMNESARVTAVKSVKTIREFEDFLRDVGGFSNAAAKAIAAGGFKSASDPRDEDERVAALLRSNIETLSRKD